MSLLINRRKVKNSRQNNIPLEAFFMSSPIGLLELCIRQNRLYSISKSNQKTIKQTMEKLRLSPRLIDKNLSFIVDCNSKKCLKAQKISSLAHFSKKQMEDYFKGDLKKFSIPLFMRGTAFQKKVWRSLQNIPWGKTKTYGQLAEELEVPGGSRAIGNCCAKNPFLIIVPCHRVLSQKGLGGFALGLKAKKQLLSLEKI